MMRNNLYAVMKCWVGVLCVLCTACCADVLTPPQKIQIHWFLGPGTGTGPQAEAVQRAFVEKFNASQDRIELVLQIGPEGGTFAGAEVLRNIVDNGESLDVIGPTGAAVVDMFAEMWLELDALMESYDIHQITPEIIDTWRREGHLVGMATGISPAVVFYNRDLFDAAGIPYPPHSYGELSADGIAWTVEEMETTALLLTLDSAGNNATQSDFDPLHIQQWGYHWGWESGLRLGTLFGDALLVDEGGNAAIPPHWRQAYHWYYNGMWEQHFIPNGHIILQLMQGNAFVSGKVAMVRSYLWYLDNIVDVPFSWDIAALPSSTETHTVGWTGGMIGISNTTEHPQEASEVLYALVTAPELLAVWGEIPLMEDLQPQFFNQLEEQYNDVDMTAVKEGLRHLGQPNLLLPHYADVQLRFDDLRDGMMWGNVDLDGEIDRLESDLQLMMAGE
jgi:multiple sugar transport system substrate-binding protein